MTILKRHTSSETLIALLSFLFLGIFVNCSSEGMKDGPSSSIPVEYWHGTNGFGGRKNLAQVNNLDSEVAQMTREQIQVKGFFKDGSWFWLLKNDGLLVETRDLTIKIYSNGVSNADRLNGLEWKGQAVVIPKVSRSFSNGIWSEWKDSWRSDSSGLLKRNGYFYASKNDGQWGIGSAFDELQRPTVEQINHSNTQ